jgi:hypothetical protein
MQANNIIDHGWVIIAVRLSLFRFNEYVEDYYTGDWSMPQMIIKAGTARHTVRIDLSTGTSTCMWTLAMDLSELRFHGQSPYFAFAAPFLCWLPRLAGTSRGRARAGWVACSLLRCMMPVIGTHARCGDWCVMGRWLKLTTIKILFSGSWQLIFNVGY